MHPQKSQIKLWAIIPAAGYGRRFSMHTLKQYQVIQGKTILEHTIERLNVLPLAGYVIALNEDDSIARTLSFNCMDKVHFCLGGKERADSVLNALHYLKSIADDDDYILVHDAARPCVTPKCLMELTDYCLTHERQAILALPVRDTLKMVSNHKIRTTVSREHLWQAQTPQMAKLGILRAALEVALNDHVNITDEASALEYSGISVDVVQGRSDNIKITYSDDLELARLILLSQQS